MCKQCNTSPVYEFTNQRRLCKNCFIEYFEKKALYIIRKFGMMRNGDIIGYKPDRDFRSAVLGKILEILKDKASIEIIKLPSKWEPTAGSSIRNPARRGLQCFSQSCSQLQHPNKKLRANKIAIPSTLDLESDEIINILIRKKMNDLNKISPVDKRTIKPLYLFLDEEVLLYAKLKNLKFKKGKEKKEKVLDFINSLEKKHPEIKRAIVNSFLKINRT